MEERKMADMTIFTRLGDTKYVCPVCGSELDGGKEDLWGCKCGKTFLIRHVTNEGNEYDYQYDVFVQAVLFVCDCSWEEVIGRSRERKYVIAREIISDYLYNTKGLSLWKIGGILGGRTNATIFNLKQLFERDHIYSPLVRFNYQQACMISGIE